MSSTNIETGIKTLFEEYVIKNKGNQYLSVQLDKNAASYYEEPKHPDQAYFSFIDTASQESLATFMETFWTDLGTPEFSGISKQLSALAFELSTDHQSQSEDVSSFVYTMY